MAIVRYYQRLFIIASLLRVVRSFASSGLVVSRRNGLGRAEDGRDISLGVFGWFSGDNSKGEKESLTTKDGKGVVNIMDGMEGFKQSQKLGTKTNSLLQELKSTRVEGSSPDGKIKVTLDAQQNPLRVAIDEQYFQSTDVLDFSNSMIVAIKDAHEKSRDKMEEKSKSFFQDINFSAYKE